MSGTLYLLPNLISDDTLGAAIPPLVLERARCVRVFFVEAAKSARAALKLYGHPGPISELSITEIGHDPDPAAVDAWLQPVLQGQDAAVLSESGCPGIADPGAQIVARAQALGIRVVPWVGPSSILLTLMASGLDGQRFRFSGYLPVHADERREAVLALERASRASETQLFIETPYRNAAMLATLIETLDPTTRLCVATDVTGASESIRTLTAASWRKLDESARMLPKLPTVFALLAAPKGEAPRYSPDAGTPVKKGGKPSFSKSGARSSFRKFGSARGR